MDAKLDSIVSGATIMSIILALMITTVKRRGGSVLPAWCSA